MLKDGAIDPNPTVSPLMMPAVMEGPRVLDCAVDKNHTAPAARGSALLSLHGEKPHSRSNDALVCLEAEHDEILGFDLRDTAKLERLAGAGPEERPVSIHSLLRDEENNRVMSFPDLANCHR